MSKTQRFTIVTPEPPGTGHQPGDALWLALADGRAVPGTVLRAGDL